MDETSYSAVSRTSETHQNPEILSNNDDDHPIADTQTRLVNRDDDISVQSTIEQADEK
jgi:hypothetical protein